MSNQFINSYHPNGIIQLSNERIAIIDDDGDRSISLFKLNKNSPYDHLEMLSRYNFEPIEVDTLTTLTRDSQYIYAITSHSRNRKGKVKNKRNRVLRFKLKNNQLVKAVAIENLRDWMVYSYPQLRKASKVKKVNEEGGLNIQGLAFDEKENQLLIGLNAPLDKQNRAIIIPLNLGDDIFKNKLINSSPNPIFNLDLNCSGILDLCYISKLSGFLILSGNEKQHGQPNQIWFWQKGMAPKKMKIKGNSQLATASGISPVILRNGEEGIVICQNDGDREKNMPGHYLYTPLKNLRYK